MRNVVGAMISLSAERESEEKTIQNLSVIGTMIGGNDDGPCPEKDDIKSKHCASL